MECPVYLFTGFLEAGKTRFLQETLSDKKFYERGGSRTLVLLCEEGEEELDPSGFASPDVFIEYIDEERRLNPDKLEALRRRVNADRVMVEYNGMWALNELYQALPEGWFVYQEIFFADAGSIEMYNANMRNLVVDKLNGCDLAVFNRCSPEIDRTALHKLVRAVTRRCDIVYESPDGKADFDDTEDPLPFDINAPVIEIEDRDYALFYRDLSENMPAYDGKTVRFLGQVNGKGRGIRDGFVIGRPIMTCCAEDITFSGLSCENGGSSVENGEWYRIEAKIKIKHSILYGRKGPVLSLVYGKHADAPREPVATFY